MKPDKITVNRLHSAEVLQHETIGYLKKTELYHFPLFTSFLDLQVVHKVIVFLISLAVEFYIKVKHDIHYCPL